MNGKTIVTGAAGALGGTVCEVLRERGADVVGIDLAEGGPAGISFIGGVDLADQAAVSDAFASAAAGSGIAGLANIAGGFAWETVMDGSVVSWERMFRMNVLTTLNACRAAVPLLTEQGAIVNVGAAATARAGAGMGAYTASKSGVARLTEALAEELKERRLRVNAVLPSIIDTAANREAMGADDAASWVTTGEVAQVVAFLLSDAASGVTGASVPVTGRV
ncbi:SDR family oxidoreductase [Novosphingobium marinum]|uniref:NAD(P)-dependent dehydrogenase (Short-subunit alcohol dehydrogenase family) n=1 Tax=Novosphingobium marinum TaxID=1514948 RepID=A0A7Y9XSX7_9SPHN|nr:SDR family oxidoreductase [Novosphingobium marinum]NYH93955.1 NAD(P)-dependent dehydrogenase (short-subunit alcohol dehydrogenase family) [Novosphingobium marinum]